MEETKRCPYCGEKILAVARKCKHCGEWLDDQKTPGQGKAAIHEPKSDTITETENDEELFLKSIPLSNLKIYGAYYAALIGLIIVTAHDIVPENGSLSTRGGGLIRIISAILNFFSSFPEWIGYVLETFGVVVLLLSLMKAMSKLKKSFDNLFIWLIIAECILATFYSFILTDSSDDFWWFAFLIVFIATMVIQVILGIKISTVYKGRINRLGKAMYVCAGLEILLFFVFIFCVSIIDNEESKYWVMVVYSILAAMVSYRYFETLHATQLHAENKEKSVVSEK